MADYDDYEDYDDAETRMARRRGSGRGGNGMLNRDQRFLITLAVTSALTLVLGVGLGFALGRATAAKQQAASPVITAETTGTDAAGVSPVATTETAPPAETTSTSVATTEPAPSVEATPADTQAPDTPEQLAPDNGDHIDAAKTTLRWSKVTDESGVTYAFEIQDRLSDGTYGHDQVISGLKTTSYKARVLTVRRRWRVWAVDSVGNKSDKSGWSYFVHTAVPVSNASTGTAN